MIDILARIFFLIWFVLTVLNQFHRGRIIHPVKRLDVVGIIPIWTFFAPNPGRNDYHLLFRDMTIDESTSVWRTIEIRGRRPFRCVWHPSRRIHKAVNDVLSQLTHTNSNEAQGRTLDKGRLIGVPYIILANFILNQPHDFRSIARQFTIARTAGGTDGLTNPTAIFLSAFHRFE
jgi:hypothetical protein